MLDGAPEVENQTEVQSGGKKSSFGLSRRSSISFTDNKKTLERRSRLSFAHPAGRQSLAPTADLTDR